MMRREKIGLMVLLTLILLVSVSTTSQSWSSYRAFVATSEATAAATQDWSTMSKMDRQLAQVKLTPEGPADKPWEQMLPPIQMVDTSAYKKNPPWNLCFSNASVANSWRVMGFALIQYEVKLHPEIGKLIVTDAHEDPKKQAADIDSLLTRKCDLLIVSPASSQELAPAVEKAAATGLPIVVFDRGVNTDKYTTFIRPIGGMAFGYSSAKWLAEQMGGKGNVLALRGLLGVDVFDDRWEAAKPVFDQYPDIKVIGEEFEKADPTKAAAITLRYLQKYDHIDGVWVAFGGASPAVYQSFVDFGAKVPPITGEDYNGWLKIWQKNRLQGFAATNPVFECRTAIIAAVHILKGESIPREWVLPQPIITNDNLDQFADQNLPDDYWAMCGCKQLPGFLENLWGTK